MPMQHQHLPHKHFSIILLLFFFFFFPFVKPDISSERAALLTLRYAVRGRTLLWYVTSPSPCNWPGVQCDACNSTVVELHLPAVALSGELPAGVFSVLPNLHTLSLRYNELSGTLPADLALCGNLRNLYLQQNLLSGEVPAFFSGMTGLVRLNLAYNNFSGEVPVGFGNLTGLRTLFLEHNRFTGKLPLLDELNELAQFNVSYNMLNGSVPKKLQTFGKDSFLGNALCGKPLALCPWDGGGSENGANGTSNSSGVGDGEGNVIENKKKKNKLSGGAIAGIVIGCVVVLLLVLFALILLCRNKSGGSKTRSVDNVVPVKQQDQHGEVGIQGDNVEDGDGNRYSVAAAAVAAMSGSGGGGERGEGGGGGGGDKKLVFFGNSVKVFDLEDLLRASAEVLGKGTFGTAYKAVLEDGPVVAVKRLKDVTLSEKEFKEKIEGVGAIDHQNLVPLRAYYYSRDEKLLVHDYMPMGSLSALLHGNKGAGRTPLNWEMRSGIALGAACGIEYLHSQGPNVSHGNIKSSNILLTKSYDAKVSDFGLAQLVGPSSSTPNRIAGYRAPEVTDPRKVSHKADVYSFGVLLLELLTGKAPTHALLNEEGVDLPRWVQSVVREEWSSEVFDIELLRYQNSEEEMVQLLQLAVDCAAPYPDNRPSMSQVRQKIEEIRKSSLKEGTQDQIQQSDLINDIDDISSR